MVDGRVRWSWGSPFASAVPSMLAALPYALACGVWVVAGDGLPGGRWFAVHLFTLGVLTNLVVGFTHHFAGQFTGLGPSQRWWWLVALNAGCVATVVGRVTARPSLVGLGGTVVTVVVLLSYVRLRRRRKEADEGRRFVWIVRLYERAHGAFVHGAILGILIGLGLLPGAWAGTARLSHLHVNLLGWGGLTLLATLVVLGPAMVRAQMVAGADQRAAAVLRSGASGLSAGVLLLLCSALGGAAGTALRIAGALGLAVFARGATVVCRDVRAAAGAGTGAARYAVTAACLWFPIALWADVVVVGTASWAYLDAVGVLVLAGVLGQVLVAALSHVAPLLRTRSTGVRDTVRSRLEVGGALRVALYNLGVAAATFAAALRSEVPAGVAGAGWLLAAGCVAWALLAVVAPVPRAIRPVNRLG